MDGERDTRTLSPRVMIWTSVIGAALVVWFLFAWLVLDRHVLDAAGESVGTALVLAVVVSIIGSVRGSR